MVAIYNGPPPRFWVRSGWPNQSCNWKPKMGNILTQRIHLVQLQTKSLNARVLEYGDWLETGKQGSESWALPVEIKWRIKTIYLALQARRGGACLSESDLLESYTAAFPRPPKIHRPLPSLPWTIEFFHFGGKWFSGVNGIKMWPGLLAGRSSVKADGHNGIKN